jgi:branched-chain amino acid transport system substrate-binding protein
MNSTTQKWLIPTIVVVLIVVGIGWLIVRNLSGGDTNIHQTLRVLAILPMTGPGASLGEYLKCGLEMGKEDVEHRFGDNLAIELNIVDSKNQPREGVSALQQALALRKPHAIICAMSSVSSAVVPIVEDQDITTIVTTTAMAGLPQDTRNIVRVYPTSENFVTPVASEIMKRYKRVAILYVHDDFGDSNQRVMVSLLKNAGVTVTASEPYELGEREFRPLLGKLLNESPEALFVTGYGPAYITIIRQIRERNRSLPLFTEIGFANPDVLEALGSDADGIVFDGTEIELEEPQTETAKAFTRRYEERFDKKPYQIAGFARDSLVMLAETSMLSDNFQSPSKQGLISLSPFSGVMGKIVLDQSGECDVQLELMERVDGVNQRLTGSDN